MSVIQKLTIGIKTRKNLIIESKPIKLESKSQDGATVVRKKYKIFVENDFDLISPIDNFNEIFKKFQFNSQLQKNITSLNYTLPTPSQMQAIPLLMEEKNVLLTAPTGSGKTASYAIPIIKMCLNSKQDIHSNYTYTSPFALIFVPTRELSYQIYQQFILLSEDLKIKLACLDKLPKKEKFRKFDVIISTPARFALHLDCKKWYSRICWIIIDECDKLFENIDSSNANLVALNKIQEQVKNDLINYMLLSATYSHIIDDWATKIVGSVVKVHINGINKSSPNVDQKLVYVSTERGKTEQLKYLFSEGVKTPVLIFVQNKNRVNQLYDYLLENLTDLKVSKLHSGLTQQERDDACINLRLGKVHITVCTDVLSRGLDFRCINTVVNYDFPSTSTTYIHRIGRTGRAGRKGVAYTYFTDDDRPYLKRIANVMYKAGCDVPQYIMDMATPTISTIKKLLKGPKRKKIGSMKRFTFFRKKSVTK